jgi:Ca2+-binding EF-hand superfamily protein
MKKLILILLFLTRFIFLQETNELKEKMDLFKQYDLDGNGYITADEIRKTNPDLTDDLIGDLYYKFDKLKKGGLDMEAFFEALD